MLIMVIILILAFLILCIFIKGLFKKVVFFVKSKLQMYKLFCWGALNNKYGEFHKDSISWEYDVDFYSVSRKIFHKGLGDVLFYGILIYSIVFLFFYHPFDEGFYVKDNNYQIGDTIVVYDNEEETKLSAVITEIRENDGYLISINGKTEKTYTKEDTYSERGKYVPKGRYVPSEDNFFIQMNKSVFLFVKNLFT